MSKNQQSNIQIDINEKMLRVFEVTREIQELKNDGIRASTKLDELLEEHRNLGREISYLMTDQNARLPNPVLDYCFRNFTDTALSSAKKVKNFMRQVEEIKGEKILSIYEDTSSRHPHMNRSKIETGIISGPCEFEIERTFRHIYVPVKQKFELRKESTNWQKSEEGILINKDIFEHPKYSFFTPDRVFETDHSRLNYIGGPGPGETKILLGNKAVDKELKKYATRTLTKKVEVTGLNFQ
ncbi:hypothetical protein K9L16_01785 [Candidatus Pacearchaeota archaeon]|nr:hypothetical protein [Candidatus Pacearchaeota archaeon]